MSRTPITLSLLVISLFTIVYPCHAENPVRLSVDFLNRDSRSISVAQGRRHGIEAGMNFAVIDSVGTEIVRFYPAEIMEDRFWSGTLEKGVFARVRSGMTVLSVAMSPEQARTLRESFRARADALKAEQNKARVAELRESLRRIEIDLKDLREERRRIMLRNQELKVSLVRDTGRRYQEIDRAEERMDDRYNDLDAFILKREDIVDRRNGLWGVENPPQEEIDRLTLEIQNLNQKINDTHRSISRLREDRRKAWQDWYRSQEKAAESELDIFKVDMKIEEVEETRNEVLIELENLLR